jgi:hypothetical protein
LPTLTVSRSLWQAICRFMQSETGSQLSPLSLIPLSQTAMQSESLRALQPDGQQPSPARHSVCRRSLTHWAEQVPGLTSLRSWQPCAGQAVGQLASGSQVSLTSLVPLSQTARQSRSWLAVQPGGQQPSSEVQAVSFPVSTQMALQVAALPSSSKVVQPRPGQTVGQLPRGSHCSAASTTPLPHSGLQSMSLAAVHPTGQQPSPCSASQAAPHIGLSGCLP